MLDKGKRKATKNWLKNHALLGLFENLEGSQVVYNQEKDAWDISVQVGFDIPKGMEIVEKGLDEDCHKEGIQTYMKEQQDHLHLKLADYFGGTAVTKDVLDYNLTYIFPPGFIAIQDGETYRLKTQEEMKRIGEQAPSLIDMMKREVELLEQGFYEFIPNTPVEEYDIYAFRLKKYSSLRARFHFTIPHEKIQSFEADSVSPIFQERNKLAS